MMSSNRLILKIEISIWYEEILNWKSVEGWVVRNSQNIGKYKFAVFLVENKDSVIFSAG